MLRRYAELKNQRSGFDSEYQVIRDLLHPTAGRFNFETYSQVAARANTRNRIYDDTATYSRQMLAAGLVAHQANASLPWFRLTTPDTGLMELASVKTWVKTVTDLTYAIFAKSNIYTAIHKLFDAAPTFGTAEAIIEERFENVVHAHVANIGEYYLGQNQYGEHNTVYRELVLTVEQTVATFGIDNVSTTVNNLWTGNKLDSSVKILHVIEPRKDFKRGSKYAKDMPFMSCYHELNSEDGKRKGMLRESGYMRFPAIVSRWAENHTPYGTGVGHNVIGSVMSLQHEHLRKANTIDYQTKPPLLLPASMRGRELSMLPGGFTFVDGLGDSTSTVRSMWEVKTDLTALLMDIKDIRERIKRSFFTDLFLMLSTDASDQRTAYEIAQRNQERLLMLGPIVTQTNTGVLGPLIDLVFDAAVKAGIVPPPPPELRGQDLEIEFISLLAQAQKAAGLTTIDRVLMKASMIAAAKQDPSVWDKVDTDQVMDIYADIAGADPRIIRPDEQVESMREQRAQAQAQAAQQQQIRETIDAAQTLSQTPTAPGTALSALTQQAGMTA